MSTHFNLQLLRSFLERRPMNGYYSHTPTPGIAQPLLKTPWKVFLFAYGPLDGRRDSTIYVGVGTRGPVATRSQYDVPSPVWSGTYLFQRRKSMMRGKAILGDPKKAFVWSPAFRHSGALHNNYMRGTQDDGKFSVPSLSSMSCVANDWCVGLDSFGSILLVFGICVFRHWWWVRLYSLFLSVYLAQYLSSRIHRCSNCCCDSDEYNWAN